MGTFETALEEMLDAVIDELTAIRAKREHHTFPIDGAWRVPEDDKIIYRCMKGRPKQLPLKRGDGITLVMSDCRVIHAKVVEQALEHLSIETAIDQGEGLPGGLVLTDLSWLLDELIKALSKQWPHSSIAEELVAPTGPTPPGSMPDLMSVGTELNAQQQTAIRHGLSRGITFLWGPPGTGKTATIASLTHEALARGLRVLVLAPSNAAVDHAALGVQNLLIASPLELQGEAARLGTVSEPILRRRYRENARLRLRRHAPEYPLDIWPGPIDELLLRRIQTSSLLVTTLPRCWIAGGLQTLFDVVIVDEASMATIPALYQAARHSRHSVVIAGDFRQLGPIVASSTPRARRWLHRDIWDLHGIPDLVAAGVDCPQLVTLHEQYRMAPPIMDIVGGLWYHGRLRSGHNTEQTKSVRHGVLGDARLVLVDTSDCPLYGRRRFENSYHAEITAALGRSLVHVPGSVALITRHIDQVRAISALCGRGRKLPIRIDSVHSYQGGEADTVIIDVTASRRHWAGDWAEARLPRSDGDRVLAVAASRARERLVLVANLDYLKSRPSFRGTVLASLIERMESGLVIPAERVRGRLRARAA
ncbi:MAG: DEAD/DEAH box helicase [Longimicrobiales bacterium]